MILPWKCMHGLGGRMRITHNNVQIDYTEDSDTQKTARNVDDNTLGTTHRLHNNMYAVRRLNSSKMRHGGRSDSCDDWNHRLKDDKAIKG